MVIQVEFVGVEFQTRIKKSDYNPVWDDVFLFSVSEAEADPGPLVVRLWDWDRAGSNEQIGTFTVDAARMWDICRTSIGWEELREWEVLDDRFRPVVGHDKQKTVVEMKIKLLDPEVPNCFDSVSILFRFIFYINLCI